MTLAWLRQLSWPELRHHPWRHLAALLAITLGVALAFSVALINQSALGEFSAAVRAVNGEPDFELRAGSAGFDERLYERVARHPQVDVASPVVEIDTQAFDARGERVPLKIVGIDALVVATTAPALLPKPASAASTGAKTDTTPLAALAPDSIFLNLRARERLGLPTQDDGTTPPTLQVQTPTGRAALQVRGSIAAPGPALAVMDIAGAQANFGWLGRLSRVDVRLVPGADSAAVQRELALPVGVRAAAPDEAAQRVSNVSRAYRVNLTVLALVALFTGAFLVFSILALSVAKRQMSLALLGVLGMTARERLQLVLVESAMLGAVGSALGLLLGTALAALALRLLAGDLGGGYFAGVAPTLRFDPWAALLYGALGIVAALLGAWLPARDAQHLAPAQALKGLGSDADARAAAWLAPALLAAGMGLALLPPVAEIPWAAYASVACLLLGGIACVPAGIALLLRAVAPPRHALLLLGVERARRQRHTATIAVAGVVASLSLAVALTVMVASFRDAVTRWLDVVLPADLYVRLAAPGVASETITLPPEFVQRCAALSGVQRVSAQRAVALQLAPGRPSVTLLARAGVDPARALPLLGELLPAREGMVSAYVSEAMVALYGARPGSTLNLPLAATSGTTATTPVFVRGVWRDYARQFGAVAIAADDYRRITGDLRVNDVALWLAAGTETNALQAAIRAAAQTLGIDGALLEFASVAEIRAVSLRIFDRSFAVTYWLQAVAIAIGLFGIAASFSAQVLARRKEFGLLAHLGLTRRQVLAIVALEGAVWTAAGALVGLLLGLAVSVVLVEVVNPQSFHWTMELLLPWGRLALLCAAVVVSGTLTAWLAARGAASRDMALAVKEDW
ncbi:MAG TPA: ABC transporter permease [Burkholderiaceae bacterium]|nr:ABC transporter permease [Burkholderiaceae bacterium]